MCTPLLDVMFVIYTWFLCVYRLCGVKERGGKEIGHALSSNPRLKSLEGLILGYDVHTTLFCCLKMLLLLLFFLLLLFLLLFLLYMYYVLYGCVYV